MASDSPERKPLDPDAVTTSEDALFDYDKGQGPLRKISAGWRRRARSGGRRGPHQPGREREERGPKR